MTLTPDHDPMGQAIADYAAHGQARRPLMVTSYMFDDDEMPVATLFRTEASMPRIELEALRRCRGHVLDVGAGAGCHTLALEARGLQVTSIDISPLSTQVRTERGAHDARCADFFADDFGRRFDTVLLLMNGLGMAGTLCCTAAASCWPEGDAYWPTRPTCATCLRTTTDSCSGTMPTDTTAKWTTS